MIFLNRTYHKKEFVNLRIGETYNRIHLDAQSQGVLRFCHFSVKLRSYQALIGFGRR